VKFERLKKLKN